MKYRILISCLLLYVAFSSSAANVDVDSLHKEDSPALPANFNSEPDGKYIFVPDSLENDVIRLLHGHSRVVDDVSKLDVEECTLFRGDTIPMVIKNSWVGRYNRGLSNFLFIPKGVWQVGVTASYGELSTEDLEVFDLLSDVDISAHIFSINPYVSYFIGNNTAVGIKFGYSNARGGIGSFKVDIDEDMNFNLHDIVYKSESYSAAVNIAQYIGLTRRGRFGLYNEVELSFKSGSSEFHRPFEGKIRNTHTTFMESQLNFSPGLQVMMMKNVAFHISFGVFGFYLKNEKQWEEGVSTGNRFTSGANFRFNLFNINFGIAVLL